MGFLALCNYIEHVYILVNARPPDGSRSETKASRLDLMQSRVSQCWELCHLAVLIISNIKFSAHNSSNSQSYPQYTVWAGFSGRWGNRAVWPAQPTEGPVKPRTDGRRLAPHCRSTPFSKIAHRLLSVGLGEVN